MIISSFAFALGTTILGLGFYCVFSLWRASHHFLFALFLLSFFVGVEASTPVRANGGSLRNFLKLVDWRRRFLSQFVSFTPLPAVFVTIFSLGAPARTSGTFSFQYSAPCYFCRGPWLMIVRSLGFLSGCTFTFAKKNVFH